MELDAKTFAILSLIIGIVVALVWDWYVDIQDEANKEDEKYWQNIEPEDEVDESDRPRSRKK